LSNTSTLDFGSNNTGDGNIMRFTGTTTQTNFVSLLVKNWSGTDYDPSTLSEPGTDLTQDRLLFASDPGFGVTGTEINSISFYRDNGDFIGHGMEISFGGTGGGFEIVAIPEPSSTALLGGMALLVLIGWRERKRLKQLGK
jgi:hypothetical protein